MPCPLKKTCRFCSSRKILVSVYHIASTRFNLIACLGTLTYTHKERYHHQKASIRAVARSRISGVLRGSRPFAGAWGRPPVSFSLAPARRKETLQQPWTSGVLRGSCPFAGAWGRPPVYLSL